MNVENMSHEPLGGLSGAFRNSQLRKPTLNKEVFAFAGTFCRLEHLLSNGQTFLRIIVIWSILSILSYAYRRYRTQRRKDWKSGRWLWGSSRILSYISPPNGIAGGTYCRNEYRSQQLACEQKRFMHIANQIKRYRPRTLSAKRDTRIVKEEEVVVASTSFTTVVGRGILAHGGIA